MSQKIRNQKFYLRKSSAQRSKFVNHLPKLIPLVTRIVLKCGIVNYLKSSRIIFFLDSARTFYVVENSFSDDVT